MCTVQNIVDPCGAVDGVQLPKNALDVIEGLAEIALGENSIVLPN